MGTNPSGMAGESDGGADLVGGGAVESTALRGYMDHYYFIPADTDKTSHPDVCRRPE